MFKRLRQLRISLAAKCQILYGSAVLVIIGAALAVPWHRMEQLTSQLNERAAGALADNAVAEHLRLQRTPGPRYDLTTRPSTLPTTSPAGDEIDADPADGRDVSIPRLLGVGTAERGLTRFEKRAVAHFRHHPDASRFFFYHQRADGSDGYAYAQPVFLTRQCAACHGEPPPGVSAAAEGSLTMTQPPAAAPAGATLASPLPIDPYSRLVGVVSVDIASRVQQNQHLLNHVIILSGGLLAGTLAIFFFYIITTRLILGPVRVLQEAAEKVSTGDLNIRSDIQTGDEFQQLSETLNTMLANLKQSSDQLRAVNKGLDLKLGQLAESNLALYESNRLKSEFLANVSHELRTPLNSILGFADLLKDAVSRDVVREGANAAHANAAVRDAAAATVHASPADSRTSRYINNILQSGKHLLDLINDLLDLAKIEAGKMDVRSEPLSLSDLFEGLGNVLKPLTESKHIHLAISVAADVPILKTDPGKLQQILYNFLSNAIKFSPTGGTIDLSARRDAFPAPGEASAGDRPTEDRIAIAVTDRGPGIDPDKQQVIFEKFRQIDASHTRTHGGTGLGLAISKELTSLLGGTIGVRSVIGEGSTFWISIPPRIEPGPMDVRGRVMVDNRE